MDANAKAPQVVMGMNLEVFKEPRGFIKILQFIFTICAFATTCGFSTFFEYQFVKNSHCNAGPQKYEYGYPFKLRDIDVALCNGTRALIGDFSSQSQYFVATGVLTFLYSLAMAIFYVFYDQMFRSNVMVPITDFGVTVVLAVFWLTSSAAWATGLADLKYFANPENFMKKYCTEHFGRTHCFEHVYSGNFASLNVSLIFGFLNFALWASNLWFLFKETPWFQRRPQGESATGQPI